MWATYIPLSEGNICRKRFCIISNESALKQSQKNQIFIKKTIHRPFPMRINPYASRNVKLLKWWLSTVNIKVSIRNPHQFALNMSVIYIPVAQKVDLNSALISHIRQILIVSEYSLCAVCVEMKFYSWPYFHSTEITNSFSAPHWNIKHAKALSIPSE